MTPPQRPGHPDWRGRGTPPPRRPPPPPRGEPPTEQLRRRPADAGPTQRIPRPPSPADVVPTQQFRRPAPPSPPPPATSSPPAPKKRRRARGLNLQTILLVCVIVIALLVGGLAGGELYARHRAATLLSAVTQCVVQDGATISFGVNPPFLWQHITGHYTNITVATDGNRVQSASGMTADVTLKDVRLQDTANSKGTIGSLNATLSWKSAGIKDTVAANLPVVGSLVTGVRTDPTAGTVILDAGSTSVTAKPVVTNGDLDLQVQDVNGPLAKDVVQTALDGLTKKLNDNYPLGIKADSVKVTDSGVVGTFSSQNAAIPKADANPCFAKL